MWGAAMDVGGWLRNLGLDKYETVFREHAIEMDVLAELTDGELAQIGVPLGDRKRLLKAIASLPKTEPSPSSKEGATPAQANPLLPLGAGRDAERRPITVMFCDLVGSTSLASKLDPEDWRNLVNAYLDEAFAAVTGFGGHVLKRLGDGLMALFGYPQAQENDAERAVRAGLAIQHALADINLKNRGKGAPELSARIGIASGPVVVEASGEVFGDAPNIAARVQAIAEPGSVLVTMNVQRQVAGLFVAEEQSARELKGVSAPVQLFRIVRASGGGRRGGARALTPFVGREEELGLLTRRWERANGGEGQLVLIVGEPGLGKSRLIAVIAEFHSQLIETPHTWLEWSASQLLQNTPLHPIAEWGRQRFGVDAPSEQRLSDLENTLRLVGLEPAEHAPLLAPLVDIPLPPERAASFPPEELRRRQLAAMRAWVLAGARSQPAVIAFEDLHWADPTSLDLLRALAERGAQSPLFVIATTRPEFRAPWAMRSHHGVVSLAPLDRAQVRRMVGEIASRHALSDEMIDRVGERTGGVPLFVEEVTRLLRAHRRSRQPCSNRSPRGSTGSAKRARSRRSARFWGAIFPTGCSAKCRHRPPDSTSCACKPRWIGSRKPTSCSSTAPLRPPPTVSGTR
jgi:class 3 adenylate cyclase